MHAAHIVGGEITVKYISVNTFEVTLNFFRDCSSLSNFDASITLGVFDKINNNQISTVFMTLSSQEILELGDACFTPLVCVEKGVYKTTITLLDNPNGYYISWQRCCRNGIITNIVNPANTSMTFYAEIPDAAIQNSTPVFNNSPDGFFCVNTLNFRNFEAGDGDGDSLVYSLITPLISGSATPSNPIPLPSPGTYPSINWNLPFNASDMVGGFPVMSINPTTGILVASPSLQGTFVFTVRVEEFRNSIKLGEIRRDVQFTGLNCTTDTPPIFLNTIADNDTIDIPYNREFCESLVFQDGDPTDTVFIDFVSDIFDSNAFFPTLIPVSPGPPPLFEYFFNNGSQSVTIPANQFDSIQNAFWNIGTIANRFCWHPKCNTIGESFRFQVNSFSLGCAGRVQDSIIFYLRVIPPQTQLDAIPDKSIGFGKEYCQDVVFVDSTVIDNLKIEIVSPIFLDGAYFPDVQPIATNTFLYFNVNGDSVLTSSSLASGVQQPIATRFCWIPDCHTIGQKFPISARLYSTECPQGLGDTISYQVTVVPPFDTLAAIPNVFTPNGDGMNDAYKIDGVSNPCDDELKVEIYNRWGTKIFESDHTNFEWNGENKSGRKAPSGTYFVVIKGIFGGEEILVEKRIVTLL